MKKEVIISTPKEIIDLIPEISMFKDRKKTIITDFVQLDEERNKLLSKEINQHYNACGCGQGRVAGIFTLLLYIVPFITGIISIREVGWKKAILYYFIISMITMFVGKIYGLIKARIALRKIAEGINIEAVHHQTIT